MPVRLLIAESSELSAQRFNSILRDAGIATRVQLVDLPMAGDALTTADLMLCNAALPQLELLLPQLRIRAPDVPIILVDHRETTMKTTQGLRMGAADVVSGEDAEKLVLVFRRELEHVTRTRRLGQLHHALQEAEQRCELLLQTSESAIAYVHEGMHIHANDMYLSLFGFSSVDEVLGLPLMDLLTEESADTLKAELRRLRQQDGDHHLPFSALTRNGSRVTGSMTLATAHYEGEACVQVTVRASTEPADGHSESADESSCKTNGVDTRPEDAAPAASGTGPAAGSTVSAFLETATELFANPAPCMALLVIQIDRFNRVRAEQGLRNGEIIGARIQEALQKHIPNYPLVRLAAHQYAVATQHRDRNELRSLCEGALKQIGGLAIGVAGASISAQISVGAMLLETEGGAPTVERVEAMLDTAFAAAVRLSDAGGNRFEVIGGSTPPVTPESESGKLLASITRAIDEESFRLLFQPIISLRGDASEHYEVFLRMLDADGTEIRPDAFFSNAIEHGVAGGIDRWVILRAIKALLAHRAAGHDTRLTISVTTNSIADPDFAPWLAVALKAARLPSDAVIFQVAEHDVVSMVRQTQAFVQALRAMHCQSSLGRFGVCDAPFEHLKLIPVDYVKLDGRLVERMSTAQSGRNEVTETLKRLQELGKLSIVPMVETASMLSVLWQGGANFVQGDYLQPAAPAMDFDFSTAD